jgi:hypothetical protein
VTGRVPQVLNMKVNAAHSVSLSKLAVNQVATNEATSTRDQNIHWL